MACPTCSHTLSVLGVLEGRRHLHCPRCGTHRIECGHGEDGAQVTHDTVPMLVARSRDLFRLIRGEAPVSAVAGFLEKQVVKLGIAESINVPADRPE